MYNQNTHDEMVFPQGTLACCNRCNQISPLPKPCTGQRENAGAYRLQTMATLDCGHMDAHWVFVADLAGQKLTGR